MTETIVGDVGGTNIRFALAQRVDNSFRIDAFRKYSNDDFPDFYSALRTYIAEVDVDAASALFALAGPPDGRTVSLTNRDWTVSADRIESEFGLERVDLVNDFTAMARSIPEMPKEAFKQIKSGEPVQDAPVLVSGPGTGLGIATLIGSVEQGWRIIGGEGGHGAFAPATDEEWGILKIYQRESGYVPNELICAGIGLNKLHRAISELNDQDCQPLSAAEISRRASNGDPICSKVCRIRASTVLRVAGDIALANGARGGVVIAGGGAVHLAEFLCEEAAVQRFVDRGVQRAYMSAIPVRVLMDETAPLVGAAALSYDFVSTR